MSGLVHRAECERSPPGLEAVKRRMHQLLDIPLMLRFQRSRLETRSDRVILPRVRSFETAGGGHERSLQLRHTRARHLEPGLVSGCQGLILPLFDAAVPSFGFGLWVPRPYLIVTLIVTLITGESW